MKKQSKWRVVLGIVGRSVFALALAACAATGFAQPARFNYQAKLTASNGSPLQGSHTMFFSLYAGGSPSSAYSGTLIFKESASVPVTNGIVNYAIGTGSNLFGGALTSALLQTASDVYVQVAVDTDNAANVILPRPRLESVPYALVSADGERRVPLSGPAPLTITQSGSYVLTSNLSVASGNAVNILSSNVTLDLNGFSITSTNPLTTGVGVLINVTGGTPSNVTILNGQISGGVVYNINNQTYSGPGFGYGILYFSSIPFTNFHVSKISVTGCANGICDGTGAEVSANAESCIVSNVSGLGIVMANVFNCRAIPCGSFGILCDTAADSTGYCTGAGNGINASTLITNCLGGSFGGTGMSTQVAINCDGQSSGGTGILCTSAENCTGYTSANTNIFHGIDCGNATNCRGVSQGSGNGLQVSTANTCSAYSLTGDAIHSDYTCINCQGLSNSIGRGIYAAHTATNCQGESSAGGKGLEVGLNAESCSGKSQSGEGLHSGGTCLNSSGQSQTGIGMYVNLSAQNCYGECLGGSSTGLLASIAVNCFGKSVTGTGLRFTTLGAMSLGQRVSPAATATVLGAGQAGTVNLP